jgi:hypothetical protein
LHDNNTKKYNGKYSNLFMTLYFVYSSDSVLPDLVGTTF